MTESAPDAPGTMWYRERLVQHLHALRQEASSQALEGIDLAALNFLVSGVGLGRCILDIEQATQTLSDLLPLTDPESIDDAITVRESTVRAMEGVEQILAHLRDWLQTPGDAPGDANTVIRDLFHGLNNMLVGINCYSELLLMNLREGDPSYAELRTIFESGGEASRLVRERASLQRLLNDASEVGGAARTSRERDILELLMQSLCGTNAFVLEEDDEPVFGDVEAQAQALPVLEGMVLREAARRRRLYV